MPFVINSSVARGGRTILDIVSAGRETWRTDTLKSAKKIDVYWAVNEDDQYEICLALKASQRMSRIPGMRRICDKSAFAMLMANYEADFFPRTYIVTPEQHSNIPKAAWKRPLIFKPDCGAAGEGIHLLFSQRDLSRRMELCKAEQAVVQEYVDAPMLIDGTKWDLRVYVVVLSLEPLRIFLCREGLARFAAEKYSPATAKNGHKVASHLTNYSISKFTNEFVHSDDPCDGETGSKRTLSSTLDYLARSGCDVDAMWASIEHIVTTSTEMMAGELLGVGTMPEGDWWPVREGNWERSGFAGSGELPGKHSKSNCFHVLGFDIMFDNKGKGWLLEVNCSPSLAIDSVFPQTGPAAEEPPEPVPGTPFEALMHTALDVMGKKGTKVCKCMAHHRPHIHHPCAVDLVAKTACIEGALLIVKRDMKGKEKTCEELAEGTAYAHCPLILGVVEGE